MYRFIYTENSCFSRLIFYIHSIYNIYVYNKIRFLSHKEFLEKYYRDKITPNGLKIFFIKKSAQYKER